MEKVTLIFTVRNEESNILRLLASIERQKLLPHQVVVVDGGSTDKTFSLLQSWKPSFPVTVLQKKGNRSVGRNLAISKAVHPIIAITDAGCVLETHWLSEIVKPFVKKSCDCVAGYYRADSQTWLQDAVSPYMLVMPNNLHKDTFLPATRSMAIRKSVWEKVGKFSESFSHNEDYHFAKKLQKENVRICFEPKAIVVWSPPSTFTSFLWQIFRFAFGDAEAGITRPKIFFIFLRYILFIGLGMYNLALFLYVLLAYVFWAVYKHRIHVHSPLALLMQPILQCSTDITVMIGTILGNVARICRRDYVSHSSDKTS